MKYLLVVLFVLMLSNICAVCNETQIDINDASLRELDKLSGVGPVRGQSIIDYRFEKSFESLEELIKGYGICEVTLEKIIEQGLACVDFEEKETEEDEEIIEEEPLISNKTKSKPRNITLETINLVPQNMKSENDNGSSKKNNYVVWGFVIFCFLLAFLFILKKRKERYKNEFRN